MNQVVRPNRIPYPASPAGVNQHQNRLPFRPALWNNIAWNPQPHSTTSTPPLLCVSAPPRETNLTSFLAMKLPPPLKTLVDTEQWTFAKTMPQWPHEYLVRKNVDEDLFEDLVRHIREHGFKGHFYRKTMTYFAEDGMLYWTMGEPVDRTIIINRCKEEDSYDNRLKNGTLPDVK